MTIRIYSQFDLDEDDLRKVRDIFLESNCPHESLTNTFTRYDHIEGGDVYFDGGNRHFVASFEVEDVRL